uniref:Piezo-type mechanosensitive ion channel component n=1 Tax=Timema bartmani TaxID=61472 RepID=A0A7R9EQ94_9NEOP|nr:unnamed protein product [Timema bartmani]
MHSWSRAATLTRDDPTCTNRVQNQSLWDHRDRTQPTAQEEQMSSAAHAHQKKRDEETRFSELPTEPRSSHEKAVENIKPRSRLESARNEEEFVGITTNISRRSTRTIYGNVLPRGTQAKSSNQQVWSITYHSWVTFVLLLWAIALCIIPDHRRRMETSSPFLVFYSILLLLVQYLYSMDLSDMELPQEVVGINLLQLGFVKTFHYPIVHLLSKGLPSVGFAGAASIDHPVMTRTSEWGRVKRGALVTDSLEDMDCGAIQAVERVAGVACASAEERDKGPDATVLDILHYHTVSQYSYRKAMRTCTSPCSPQSLSKSSKKKTHHSDKDLLKKSHLTAVLVIQQELGLERYETGIDLFIQLLSTVFFLIVTVVQLHYCHKEFLKMSELRQRSGTVHQIANSKIAMKQDHGSVKEKRDRQLSLDPNKRLLVVTTLFALVEVVQLFKRHRDGVVLTRPSVLFPQITRVHADYGVESCLKYLINYGFYKFGVEICLVKMVVLIALRMDVYALFYAFWLCLLFSINRENLGKFWFFLQLFIMIVIPIQYFMVIGLPPGLCIGDFVLLLFVCQQSLVMNIERRSVIENYPGGSNRCIFWEINQPGFVNPVPDFITYTRYTQRRHTSWLDGLKRVFIMVENWLVLGIVFMAGTSQVNLFSIGYLVGTFILMWQGGETYLMPIPVIMQRWNILLAYNVGVITLKTAFQIVGCVFAEEAHSVGSKDIEICPTRSYQGGVAWDVICFAALIFRRRLFNSYYFLHLINELKAMRALASRGAELIEELQLSRVVEQQIQERQTLKTIKVKMERIKSTQQKIQGARFKEPENHYAAVRSGDYFMFDEVEDVDEDENEDDDDKNLLNPETRGITVSKFLATAIKTDMENAADLCLDQDSESGVLRKIWILIKFLLAFVESCIVSITQYLNMKTRDFRYVIRSLAAEKKLLKEKITQGKTENQSVLTTRQLDGKLIKTKNFMLKSSQPPFPLPERDVNKSIELLDLPEETAKKDHIIDVDMRSDLLLRTVDQPPIVQLFIALYYALLSHSELISYLAVFIHQMKSASILSLPLPLMVFLWGTLNIPRPSKTFWVTLLAYTEFDLIAWNQHSTSDNVPLYPPRIIGIEQNTNYFFIDLVLLLVLFSHRIMLKSLGLWKSDYEDPVRFTKKEEMFIVESTSLDMALFSHDDNNPNVTTRGGSLLNPDEGTPSYQPHFSKQVLVRTEVQNIMDYYPAVINLAYQLLAPRPRHTVDVYTPMFFCDFLNFLVIVIGVESFAQEYSGDVMTYLMENKVPMLFLSMLLMQFFLIVVDRALYLRKNIVGKIVFHYILVIGIHIWMFFVLPGFTERQFNMRLPPQIWYIFKCMYFLLSAYQIRCGYPTRIIGNVFCKKYNISNFVLLIGYLNLPFLYELRTLMDWMWTDTSMSVFEWLKMEDIFNNVFQTKCSRRIELKYPQARGVKRRALFKYLMGGGAQIMIIAMIWLPLLVFALGRQVGKPNIPYEVSVSLSIDAYTPLYTMKAKYIKSINEQQWSQMINIYKANRESSTILSGYDEEDIGVISLGGNSTAVWGISPPDLDKLILEGLATTLVFKLRWNLRRHSNSPTVPEEVTGFSNWDLVAGDPQRKVMASMLSKTNTSQSLKLQDVLPKFLKVTSKTQGVAMKQLLDFNGMRKEAFERQYSRVRVDREWEKITLSRPDRDSNLISSSSAG